MLVLRECIVIEALFCVQFVIWKMFGKLKESVLERPFDKSS